MYQPSEVEIVNLEWLGRIILGFGSLIAFIFFCCLALAYAVQEQRNWNIRKRARRIARIRKIRKSIYCTKCETESIIGSD
jgi:cytochrome c-type biogenesis protein CcmH/NrfF